MIPEEAIQMNRDYDQKRKHDKILAINMHHETFSFFEPLCIESPAFMTRRGHTLKIKFFEAVKGAIDEFYEGINAL